MIHFKKNNTEITNEINSYQINEIDWLRSNVMAQSLSNGYCNLPLGQGRCPHANTCLNCANFKTEQSYLPQHEKQLVVTKKILDVEEKNNWLKQIAVNNEVKVNLEKIIYTLNGIKDV